MLTTVVEYGTASEIRTDRLKLAGKTGTAEKIDPITGRYVPGLFNSSFVGMAPVDRPELVCLVVLDEPSQLKYGGQSAAPIFREIVDRLLANPDYPLARQAKKSLEVAADSVIVPDFRGYRHADATKLLSGNRHVLTTKGTGDIVVGQEPQPGTRVLAGQPVTLSLGNINNRLMPDLTNNTLRDAMLKLKDLGVEVEYSGNGRIIHQVPPSGTPVRQGEKCQLTLGWMG
jgi:membrane peptidoglycan carboxypeptidase